MSPTASTLLVDWKGAGRSARRFAGPPSQVAPAERARLAEDVAEVVSAADALVSEFTGLSLNGKPASRPWVMTRGEWIDQNLRGFEQILEPVARKLLETRNGHGSGTLRRRVLAFQFGAILGYLGRKVLGQYDLFLPADDRDIVYFVGPNIVELERRHRFPKRDFRMWLALHEVTHRLQFEGVPWLRPYVGDLIGSYLGTMDLDARKMLDRLRHALDEIRAGSHQRDLGVLFALMSPEQRETFRKMQALMSLLEGHGNFVMETLSEGHVRGADRMRRTLQQRRRQGGLGRAMQKAVGLDVKVRQYDMGANFVSEVSAVAGPEGFARVWERPENVPSLEEVARPHDWVDRVVTG
ncbi:MAG: zinc-dependent metalloprotease [Actinomycetota bacterium]